MNEQDKARADISNLMDTLWYFGRRRFEDLTDAEKYKLTALLMLQEPARDRLSEFNHYDDNNEISALLISFLKNPIAPVKDRLMEVMQECAVKKMRLSIDSLFEDRERDDLYGNHGIGEPDYEYSR